MFRKRFLTFAATVTGVSLLAIALFAGGASSQPASADTHAKKGGTFNINLANTDVDFSDPALAYFTYSETLMRAACSTLLSNMDKRAPEGTKVYPDGAAGAPKVSSDGKTYTFTVRPGLKFASGKPVTAANYAFSINRNLNAAINSPAVAYMHEIVGADAVLSGKAKSASGVVAKGNILTIHLTQAIPDFEYRLALTFFCPLPTDTPTTAAGVNTFDGSGPYTIASRTPNRQLVLVTNKFYKGPRPHNFDRIVITANVDLNQSLLQVKSGQADLDIGGLPPTAHADLGKTYGVNKSQYRVDPSLETDFIPLRTDRGVFTDVNLRKAVNWALDRPQMLRARGAYAGKRDDQLLGSLVPGYRDVKIYSFRGANVDLGKKAIAKSATCKSGCSVTLYTANAGAFATQAQVVQYNMKQIGINVNIQQFTRSVEHSKCGTKAEQFDMCIEGWGADYPDPITFLSPLLNGRNIVETNNNDMSYFNNPQINAQIQAASALTGEKRYSTFNSIDTNVQRQFAATAPFLHRTQRFLISSRIDPKCYVYDPIISMVDVTAGCLK